MNKLTLPPFIPVLPALYYVAVIRVGWKRLAGVINIYHFIENKHNPPVYPQPQKEQWAVSGEQRQPLPFVIPLTPRLLRGLRACLALPTPCVPPQLGRWVQASGHCQRAGGRASPMETPQCRTTSSLSNGMEMGAMGWRWGQWGLPFAHPIPSPNAPPGHKPSPNPWEGAGSCPGAGQSAAGASPSSRHGETGLEGASSLLSPAEELIILFSHYAGIKPILE